MAKNIKKRSASHIYFGVNKLTGELKHISEVPSGQKCNCMRRCPITVAREVQTGESVPIVHEMVVANPHSWLDIIRMMVYY